MKKFILSVLSFAFALFADAGTVAMNLRFISDKQNQTPEDAWTTPAMKADLANIMAEIANTSESTRHWKQDGSSSRFCITANYDLSTPQELRANGMPLRTTEGLLFVTATNADNNIRIDPNNSRGLMLLGGCTLIIPNLHKGDHLLFGTRSGSSGKTRTWTMTNASVVSGSLVTSSGVFNDVVSIVDADGDVTLSPDDLMDLSYITVFVAGSQGGEGPDTEHVLGIWSFDQLKHVRQNLYSDTYLTAYLQLLGKAENLLGATPVSVMMKEHVPASGDKHDYESLSRYFWPNPNTPDGLPYVSRDGVSNPELEEYDRNKLSKMAETVSTLALAYYLSGEEKYAAKATEQVRVWFLNADTKMNPNMNYAQMVPGQNGGKGRVYGVLDAFSFADMIDAIPLLEESESFTDEDAAGVHAWFTEFLNWMLTSDLGKGAGNTTNNHGTIYDKQIIMYANFVGDEYTRDLYIHNFFERRIDAQINTDGRQPLELSRTLAYHYSQFNLTHMLDVFHIARHVGTEVGGNSAESFQKVATALDFLAQYLGKENDWPYQQISGWDGAQRDLARDLYRAWLLFPEHEEWKNLYDQYGSSGSNERFVLLNLLDDSTTGIRNLNGNDNNNNNGNDMAIYNLNGRKVAELTSNFLPSASSNLTLPNGIYIVGGKKVVLRAISSMVK